MAPAKLAFPWAREKGGRSQRPPPPQPPQGLRLPTSPQPMRVSTYKGSLKKQDECFILPQKGNMGQSEGERQRTLPALLAVLPAPRAARGCPRARSSASARTRPQRADRSRAKGKRGAGKRRGGATVSISAPSSPGSFTVHSGARQTLPGRSRSPGRSCRRCHHREHIRVLHAVLLRLLFTAPF